MTQNQVLKKVQSKPNIICICIREPRFCLCTKKEIPGKHNVFEMEMRLPIEIENEKNWEIKVLGLTYQMNNNNKTIMARNANYSLDCIRTRRLRFSQEADV